MSDKVTKFDLLEAVHVETKCEKKTINLVLDSLIEQIKLSLKNGKTIELRGFGTFEIKHRKEKKNARNPKTGETLVSKPHNVVSFRSGKELKESVWNIPFPDE